MSPSFPGKEKHLNRWTPALILAGPGPATPGTFLHLHCVPGSHGLEVMDTGSMEGKRKVHSK